MLSVALGEEGKELTFYFYFFMMGIEEKCDWEDARLLGFYWEDSLSFSAHIAIAVFLGGGFVKEMRGMGG
jgi:hypothetical protein